MKPALLIISLFIGQHLFSQSTDFILFKKHNKTIGSYYAGNNIAFTTQDGTYIEALITKIKNDTLFLRQFVVQQIPTNLGVYILDTVSSYHYQFHYKQIKSIGKTGPRFDVSAGAAVLMGGGILLTAASAVVYLVDRQKFSPELMIAGIALGGIGFLMAKLGGKGMVIGKKYSLVYVEVNHNKKG
jgi:hypothetical protein